MSKKTKSKSKSSGIQTLSPQALVQSATSFYLVGDYKSALPRYEKLYKETPDERIKERLIHCLIERSKQLHEKQMFVEASALLANLHILDSASLPVNDYLACLIGARYFSKANKICAEKGLDIHSISPALAEWLATDAAINYSSSEKSTELFQQDCIAIQTIFSSMDNAASPDQLMTEIKMISLRSPLKALRLVLQSLLLFQTNPALSLKFAREIESSSPYFIIARVITLACQSPIDLFMNLSDLSTLQLQLLQILKGWSDQQVETLMTAVSVLLKQANAIKKVKFIMQLHDIIPENLIKQLCISLYDGNTATWKPIAERFGNESFIRLKLKAIHAEKKPDPWSCIEYWDDCITAIKQSKDLSPELIGLIRLHQYEVITKRSDPEYDECVDWLIDSLEYLPNRKETYTDIFNWYAKGNKKTLSDKWLAKMLAKFPDDINVLLNTAKESLQKKTFTKAINVLKKVLTLDSINTLAKQLLARAYFEKTLFEISKNKISLALSSLAHSKTLQQYLHTSCLISISESLLACHQGDPLTMTNQLHLAYQQAGNKLLVNYLIEYYAAELKINILKLRTIFIWDAPDATALATLTQGLHNIIVYLDHHSIKKILLIGVTPALKQQVAAAILACSSYDDFELLCAYFLRLKFYAFLIMASQTALKYHKKAPLFNYYHIQGKIKGDASKVTDKQYDSLVHDIETLPESERLKTGQLIAALLDEADRYHRPSLKDNPFPDGLLDVLEKLFG